MVEIYLVGKKGIQHWKMFTNFSRAKKYAKKIGSDVVNIFKFDESIRI